MFAIAVTAVTFCVRTSWPLCRSPPICSLPPGMGIAMVAGYAVSYYVSVVLWGCTVARRAVVKSVSALSRAVG